MRSIFGWSYPPGCTSADVDRAMGCDGPLDCPICANGEELAGSDCPHCASPICETHGCPVCDGTETKRRYCSGPFCGDYLRGDSPGIEKDGRLYCSEACAASAVISCDICGAPGYLGVCQECANIEAWKKEANA
jgi:hypothetical protein